MSSSSASSSTTVSSPFDEQLKDHRGESLYPISPKEQLAVMPSDLLRDEEPAAAFEENACFEADFPLQQHLESSRQRRRPVV